MLAASQVLTVVGFVVFWQLAVTDANRATLGTPGNVAKEVWYWLTRGERWSATGSTLREAGSGVVLAVLIGIAIAIIVMSSRHVYVLSRPLFAAINATPKLVLAPLFTLLWGIGSTSRIYYIAFAFFFFPFAAIVTAYDDIDPDLKSSLRILGASRWAIARQLYVPTMCAGLLTSFRFVIPWALAATVLAETLVRQPGNMGFVVSNGQALLNSSEVLGAVVFLALIALGADRIIALIELRYFRWRD